ncbi:LPXTG cell wall anchor domain-containing protein [Romboutsia lituseburensis]|uniref:LPXTG cell wall anchor domain-containing protein n=1 Tax=Romboutsia lituseburensis TaxID=1537 RepID=UPI00215AA1E5|nr:LPXTG cell wall anchor domain-containing protein [Romboutsia lituseburensis]MCR8743739.1 LPXTG cell wall anchor domain-containing protein [Romboutsia lituseburensis]
MALKKMKNKCLAIGLTVVFSGGNILLASANETINNNEKNLKIEKQHNNEETKTYIFKNKIIIENESENEKKLNRENLSETSHVEEKEGKIYVTLGFNEKIDEKSNLEILVNDKVVNHETIENKLNKDNTSVKFEVSSLKDKITVKKNITDLNTQTKYDIVLVKESVNEEFTSKEENTNKPQDNNTKPVDKNIQANKNEQANLEKTENQTSQVKNIKSNIGKLSSIENTVKVNNVENSANNNTINNLNPTNKTYTRSGQILQKPSTSGKLSSIKNDIIALSEEAKALGSEQLNDITFIEEVNGKTYAIFDFIDAVASDSNIRIDVNDKQVSYETISSHLAKGRMRIKFEIPNIYADIKVKSYVEIKKKDIEYNVKLIKSTLKVESENSTQTNNNNNNNNNSSTTTKPKLPQTGIGFDGAMITGLGATMIVAGAALTKKKDE